MNMKMLRKLVLIGMGVFVLSGCGNTSVVNDNTVAAPQSNTSATNTVDTDTSSQNRSNTFYYAENTPNVTYVYSVNVSSGAKSEVFHFDNGITEPSFHQFNTVSFAPATQLFIYSTDQGLYSYSLVSNKTEPLVVGTPSGKKTVDEIGIMEWSDPALGPGIFYLEDPSISADGKYVYFLGAMYEGVSNYIYNLSDDTLIALKEGQYNGLLGGVETSWMQTDTLIATGSFDGMVIPGVFTAEPKGFSPIHNFFPELEKYDNSTSFTIENNSLPYDEKSIIVAVGDLSKSNYSITSSHIELLNTATSEKTNLFTVEKPLELNAFDNNTLVYTLSNGDDLDAIGLYNFINKQQVYPKIEVARNHYLSVQNGSNNDSAVGLFEEISDDHKSTLKVYSVPDWQVLYSIEDDVPSSKLFLGFASS